MTRPSDSDNASFRDPAGRVVVEENRVVRWVDASYREHYDAFHNSTLSRRLRDRGWLIEYDEIEGPGDDAYRKLASEKIPFISYPYEWSFSQLKEAALLTLEIQLALLKEGFVLKDATPFNVQFRGSRPVFIDLLSFEVRNEGDPWLAYRQFCETFLAPLLLMARVHVDTGALLRPYLDGIPLDLCSKLLPFSAKIRPLTFVHVVLHSMLGGSGREVKPSTQKARTVGRESLLSITRQLAAIVRGLEPKAAGSFWSSYYDSHLNYTEEGFRGKRRFLEQVLERRRPARVWDLGSNVGLFSEICANASSDVVAFDSDAICVDRHYRRLRERDDPRILPLRMDLSNPSPGIGWHNRERRSFLERGTADLVLALGLIHHLRLTHNVPFEMQAELFARCGKRLLVEFIGARDEMARRLGLHKPLLLAEQTESRFLAAFERHFAVEDVVRLEDADRSLFLLRSSARESSLQPVPVDG